MGKLSPGERAHNWAQALVTLWPVLLALMGGAVYGNSETVRNWIHGADDIVPSEAGFNEQVIHAIEKINDKLAEQDALIGKLKSRDYSDQKKLQTQIDDIKKLVN
jgi:hypothetical protein